MPYTSKSAKQRATWRTGSAPPGSRCWMLLSDGSASPVVWDCCGSASPGGSEKITGFVQRACFRQHVTASRALTHKRLQAASLRSAVCTSAIAARFRSVWLQSVDLHLCSGTPVAVYSDVSECGSLWTDDVAHRAQKDCVAVLSGLP